MNSGAKNDFANNLQISQENVYCEERKKGEMVLKLENGNTVITTDNRKIQ